LHAMLTIPITGDIRPGFLHPERAVAGGSSARVLAADPDENEGDQPTFFTTAALHFADGVLGPHGLLSHFPILLIGVGGIGVVLHRHWPAATKTLAVVSILSAILIVGVYVSFDPDWGQPMFAVRWF